MKKNNDKIKKMLGDSSNSLVDKLSSIKYITKKDSKLLSSVVSGVLKKKKITTFLLQKKSTLDASRFVHLLKVH